MAQYEVIKFNDYDTVVKNAKVKTNGISVQLTIENPIQSISIRGLNDDKYKFQKIIFHWPSQHAFSATYSPLEMQIVHYNTRYEEEDEAITEKDGLAILAFLFRISNEENLILRPITDALDYIMKENTSKTIRNFLLPYDRDIASTDYYRYWGSLTSSPCYQSAPWTIFKERLTISQSQLEKFHRLKKKTGASSVNNSQLVELTNGKIVQFYSIKPEDDDDTSEEDHKKKKPVKIKPIFIPKFKVKRSKGGRSSRRGRGRNNGVSTETPKVTLLLLIVVWGGAYDYLVI
ncbi:carbonic anhydrase 2-like [Centruroides sculpturatus]|uniref:carbonic anhydrase 2-like n=1 Tax=Centruroides sculpturatus TaxID=218467 RepID=UPI000C6D4954|nr:carbonic anhydrase 2-like [Centruroides sculpturatus]